MKDDDEHDFVGPGWDWKVAVHESNTILIVHWPPGAMDSDEHFGVEHWHTWSDGTRIKVAPRLDSHEVDGADRHRITVSPSILCGCGLHGFLEAGTWRDV